MKKCSIMHRCGGASGRGHAPLLLVSYLHHRSSDHSQNSSNCTNIHHTSHLYSTHIAFRAMDSFSLKRKEKATADDGFFMERLEMLYEQSLGELRAFAEREGRAYDEVRVRG